MDMNDDVAAITASTSAILESPRFRAALNQTQHRHTTTANHMIDVAIICNDLCNCFLGLDRQVLLQAALLHDIAIPERDERYGSGFQEIIEHSDDSVRIAEQEYSVSERAVSAIRTHMFPLVPRLPRTKEGWALTLADKIASVSEYFGFTIREPMHQALLA